MALAVSPGQSLQGIAIVAAGDAIVAGRLEVVAAWEAEGAEAKFAEAVSKLIRY